MIIYFNMYFEITNYTLIIFSKEANDGLRSRVIFDPSLSSALSKRIFNKEEFNIAGSLEKRSILSERHVLPIIDLPQVILQKQRWCYYGFWK